MRRPSAERLFATLARLLPAGFRAEYGAEMSAHFAERATEARGRGRARFLWFVLRELAGVVRAIATERVTGLVGRRPVAPASRRNDGPVARDHEGHRPHRKVIDPMTNLLNEARHAARRLARTPGFTVASIATLALAIAANAAIFTLLHRMVLSPLPYPAAERLVALEHAAPGWGMPSGLGMTTGLYREYAALPSVEAIALYRTAEATLSGDAGAESLESLYATPSLGGVLGARPALGRWFAEADGRVGAPGVVVLTHALWERRFGASPAVLGRTLRVGGDAYEVIGVMPPDFAFPDDDPQLVLPIRLDPAAARAGGFNYLGIARLRPGMSAEAARPQQDAVIADLAARFPDEPDIARTIIDELRLGSLAGPFRDEVLGDTARTLWVLLGSAMIVLIIACANLANLFLVRAESRQREVAVRRALGAGTTRVAAYFAAETLLVASLSGALGLWLAHVAVEVLVQHGPVELPRLHEVRIDGVVVAFTALASLTAGASFGLMPLARRLPAVASVLQDAGRGNTGGGRQMRARNALMAIQVALAAMLLIAAGLMTRSFLRLLDVDPGFRSESRLVFRIGLPDSDYATRESAASFHERLLERAHALPGVERAALTTVLPLDGYGWGDPIRVRGRAPGPEEGMGPTLRFRRVSADYFTTLRIPLRRGRLLDAGDADGSTNAVVVDEALAALYFPDEDPVGRRIRPVGAGDDADGWLTVVGVVGKTASAGLRESAPSATLYLPLRTAMSAGTPSTRQATYVLQTRGDPLALVPAVRRTLAELDPNLALARPERLSDVVAHAGADVAFTLALLGLAAAVALLLGLVGVYAVISYGVAQRRAEIGVRLALGAEPGAVTALIVRQSGRVIGLGVLIGLIAAVASSRLIRALLFGVAWNDPLTYAGVTAGLFGMAMLACWVPARRAARRDPVEALRG